MPNERLVKTIAALLTIIAIAANGDLLRKGLESFPWPAGHDKTSQALARYAAVRAALPQRGEVGYIIDLPADNPDRAKIRRRCRYALAPIILVDRDDLPLVLSESASGSPAPLLPGYEIRRDFGVDLKLLAKQGSALLVDAPAAATGEKQSSLWGLTLGIILWPLALWPWLSFLGATGKSLTLIWLWRLSAAWCLGTGLSSCFYYAYLVLAGEAEGYWLCEIPLAAAVFVSGAIMRRFSPAPPPSAPDTESNSPPRLVAVATALILALAASILIARSLDRPHGEWDAQKIWNYRAIFLHEAGKHWRDGFSPRHIGGLPDYPCLVPCAVARLWAWHGSRTVWSPIAISLLFAAGAIAASASIVGMLRGPTMACLAASALAASALFLREGAAQQADIPVAFFLILGFGGLAMVLCTPEADMAGCQRVWLIISSMSLGLATWTKNEGLMLLLAWLIAGGLTAWRWRGMRFCLRSMGLGLMGALLPLLVLCHFKYSLAPPNEIARSIGWEAFSTHLFTLDRHLCIWSAFLRRLWHHGQIAPLAAIVLPALVYRQHWSVLATPAAFLALTLLAVAVCGYYGVYLITPYDLKWHVQTSIDRLLAQIWPLAIVGICTSLSDRERCLHCNR